jgi:hypothetical protein
LAQPVCDTARPARRKAVWAAGALVATLLGLGPAAGEAMLTPCREQEGRLYATRTDRIAVVFARLDVDGRAATELDRWPASLELVLRNPGPATQTVCLLAPEDGTSGPVSVQVRGKPVRAPLSEVSFDPAVSDATFSSARRIEVELTPGEMVAVRVSRSATVSSDEQGQRFMELPTHLLAGFSAGVAAASIDVAFDTRALGFRATLGSALLYDEPDARARWYVKDWRPSVPLTLAWVSPWTALRWIAQRERCPLPTELVESAARSPAAVTSLVSGLTADQRLRCSSLPGLLHGAPATGIDLGSMAVADHVSGVSQSVSLYDANPGWTPSMLSQAEALYARLLAP